MKTLITLLVGNVPVGLCGWLTLTTASASWQAIWAMLFSVGLFCNLAYLLSYTKPVPPVRDLEQRVSRPVPTRSFAHAKHVPDRQAHTAQLRRVR